MKMRKNNDNIDEEEKEELKIKNVTDKVIIVENGKTKKEKKKKEKAPKIKDNFVPPDGGWGWIIVIAAGFSNFCIFPLMQSFGLIFRDRFIEMGISSSEITTLMNINNATTAFIGLANGPLFRKYSSRKIGIVGGLICAISITLLSRMESFTGFLIFFSILYGIGIGITMSANALTLNTYFKEKRRIATGLTWTVTGMGPIVMPLIITQLMAFYGMEGTVLIYGGLAFNAAACSLFFQPVSWHEKKKVANDPELAKSSEIEPKTEVSPNEASEKLLHTEHNVSMENIIRARKMSLGSEQFSAKEMFGSQYLYYDDKEQGASGIDVIGPGTPMMSRANDGLFSKLNASNASLASRRENSVRSRRPSLGSRQSLNRLSSDFDYRKRRNTLENPLVAVNETINENADQDKMMVTNLQGGKNSALTEEATIPKDVQKKTVKHHLRNFGRAIIVFFDLDLLRDPIYVNLMLGITFANFTELNFALLTPFILGEYGFTKLEVATFMSTLGGVDVITRIVIPFVATYIGWENRTFFLIGVGGLGIGRLVLAHVHTYGVSIAVAILMGIGKAMRTIFMALVIPTHVPLSRLPAASGLQLVTSGIVFVCVGPIVGWLRDSLGDYAITLHCLNIFTYLTIISWLLEAWYTNSRRKKDNNRQEEK